LELDESILARVKDLGVKIAVGQRHGTRRGGAEHGCKAKSRHFARHLPNSEFSQSISQFSCDVAARIEKTNVCQPIVFCAEKAKAPLCHSLCQEEFDSDGSTLRKYFDEKHPNHELEDILVFATRKWRDLLLKLSECLALLDETGPDEYETYPSRRRAMVHPALPTLVKITALVVSSMARCANPNHIHRDESSHCMDASRDRMSDQIWINIERARSITCLPIAISEQGDQTS